jgi:hypothetical protein
LKNQPPSLTRWKQKEPIEKNCGASEKTHAFEKPVPYTGLIIAGL